MPALVAGRTFCGVIFGAANQSPSPRAFGLVGGKCERRIKHLRREYSGCESASTRVNALKPANASGVLRMHARGLKVHRVHRAGLPVAAPHPALLDEFHDDQAVMLEYMPRRMKRIVGGVKI